ncbi:MAG: septum formation initiator family protein [Rikenellaceae bacterium]
MDSATLLKIWRAIFGAVKRGALYVSEMLMLYRLRYKPRTKGDLFSYLLIVGFLVIYGYRSREIFQNLSQVYATKSEISRLRSEASAHRRSITSDSLLIQKLKSNEGLIQYAREQHKMTRPNETIYNLK